MLENFNINDEIAPIDVKHFKASNLINQQKMNWTVNFQSFAMDMHPVVNYKIYKVVFGEDLLKYKEQMQIHFPSFNENLKFRVSQRMVIFI